MCGTLTNVENTRFVGGGRYAGRPVGEPEGGGGPRVTANLFKGDGEHPGGVTRVNQPHLQAELLLADVPGLALHLPATRRILHIL